MISWLVFVLFLRIQDFSLLDSSLTSLQLRENGQNLILLYKKLWKKIHVVKVRYLAELKDGRIAAGCEDASIRI